MDDDDDDLQTEANDLGDVQTEEESANKSLDDIDRALVDEDNNDDDAKGQREAEMVVDEDEKGEKIQSHSHNIGEIAQDNAVQEATTFVSSEDKHEEDAIHAAQARE